MLKQNIISYLIFSAQYPLRSPIPAINCTIKYVRCIDTQIQPYWCRILGESRLESSIAFDTTRNPFLLWAPDRTHFWLGYGGKSIFPLCIVLLTPIWLPPKNILGWEVGGGGGEGKITSSPFRPCAFFASTLRSKHMLFLDQKLCFLTYQTYQYSKALLNLR